MAENILLIVVVAKNESRNIARCLSSLGQDKAPGWKKEVVVVDSLSSDNTLEEAEKFSSKIIQPQPSWPHSAGAGRYLGCLNSQGRYIFCIDADMRLKKRFLEKGINFMEEHPEAAAVAGIGQEVYIEKESVEARNKNMYLRDLKEVKEVKYLGGAALFRKEPLKKAGYFNPFLYAHEELEVCQKMRLAGGKIYTIPVEMTIHYTYSAAGMKRFKKQLKSNRFTGIGQMLRLSLTNGFFWENVFKFRKILLSLFLIVLAAILAPVFLATANRPGLLTIAAGIIFLFFYLAVVKKSLVKAALSLGKWIIILVMVIKGFFLTVRKRWEYPTEVKMVKRGSLE
ncbi:MAG: glycosyltransferase [Candidatus Omnitrophica bacterium]|nr:glycosyltransferase [Candidatus Omnitrophota bacterium]